MLFLVKDLKLMKKNVAYSNEEGLLELRMFIKKRQPVLFDEIEFVMTDRRSIETGNYCLLFCGIALEMAELIYNFKFRKISDYRMQIARRLIAQEKYAVKKDFDIIISRLEKHILNKLKFDEDDTFWLKLNIGAFIILLDLQLNDKEEIIEDYADLE